MGGCSAHQQRLSEDCAAALLGCEWSHHCLCDKHMGKRSKELEERAQTTASVKSGLGVAQAAPKGRMTHRYLRLFTQREEVGNGNSHVDRRTVGQHARRWAGRGVNGGNERVVVELKGHAVVRQVEPVERGEEIHVLGYLPGARDAGALSAAAERRSRPLFEFVHPTPGAELLQLIFEESAMQLRLANRAAHHIAPLVRDLQLVDVAGYGAGVHEGHPAA